LTLLAANTTSPRPPLNIFEASRKQLQGNTWFKIAEVPRYTIPANNPIPQRVVNAVAIMTGLVITNVTNTAIRASARIKGTDSVYYTVIDSAPIPPNDFLTVSIERQVMMSSEILEISIPSNTNASANHAHVHFSYIVNQREEFVVL
jgi:hypothetical protein